MYMVSMMTISFSARGFGHPVFLKPHFGHPVMKILAKTLAQGSGPNDTRASVKPLCRILITSSEGIPCLPYKWTQMHDVIE